MSKPQIVSNVAVLPANDAAALTPAHRCSPATVRSFGLTDIGRVREVNEDQFLVAVLLKALHIEQTSLPQNRVQRSGDHGYLLVVADGMGGHAGGSKASALAVGSVEHFILGAFKWFACCIGAEQDEIIADFQRALGHANARVLAEAEARPELEGMGSTLTLAYIVDEVLFVAHAGDSRCYLCRDSKLYRVTRDHTVVNEMVQQGALTAEQAAHHRWRHVITNAVGSNSRAIKAEVHKLRLENGDRLLLCSDGLTDMVSEEEINQVLVAQAEPEQACRRLVQRANEAGGKDNITVVVTHFDQPARRHADDRNASDLDTTLVHTRAEDRRV